MAHVAPARLHQAPSRSPSQTAYGLSPRLTRLARDRLSKLALAICAAAVFPMLMSWTVPVVHGGGRREVVLLLVVNSFGVLGSLGLWWAATKSRLSDSAVLDLGLLFQVAGCLVMAIFIPIVIYGARSSTPEASPIALWILFQPIVVPSPLRRAAVASVASAATAPLGLVLASQFGGVEATPEDFVAWTMMPALAAGLAVYASRVVHELAVDVGKSEMLGSYILDDRLGEGGMGEVWTAHHAMLARPSAVKLIRADMFEGASDRAAQLRARFDREARITAGLRSPHTVEVYDYGLTEDGRFYYAMELLDGIDLGTLVKRHGPQPPARVVHILRQACRSLDEAHAEGLIHRDIKPANLMLCRYGRDRDFVKVLDFGLVRAPREQQLEMDATQAGSLVGTPGYMAPELASEGEVDGRSDLYALGCVAFALLTGERVFPSATPLDAIVRHARDTPEPPSARRVGIPPALDAIVLSLLEKSPADRPADAREVEKRLAALTLADAWTEDDAAAWWAGAGSDASPVAPGPLSETADVAPPLSVTPLVVPRADHSGTTAPTKTIGPGGLPEGPEELAP